MTWLFYDAGCGLCQGAVHLVARRDRSGGIRFAPLGGATFEHLIPSVPKAGLPDSLLVLTPQGELLSRSQAVIHLLRRMGPTWRLAAQLLTWIPPGLGDAAYDLVARRRSRRGACGRPDAVQDERFES